MTGRGAANRVAMKNARRNRKRTIFLVLLVAVPVAFGVIVAGLVRATTLTPEEQAQSYFGSADARIQVASADPDVTRWVTDTVRELSPDVMVTELRAAWIRVEDVGYSPVWDLDMSEPATEGFLVRVSGDSPVAANEVAISPHLAEAMEVGVGDTVEFGALPLGELEVVGLVSEPFYFNSNHILLAPEGLAAFAGDPALGPEPGLLVSGPDAGDVALRVNDLWYERGQQLFWPEPAVDPLPPEISFLADDPYTYLLLTEREIDELAELVAGADPSEDAWQIVYDAAHRMIYGSGEYRSLPDIYVETRVRWLSYSGLESDPGVMSTGAAAILLIEVAFITGAAFAAGTRRRLREIGLMGANGASEKHVRSTVVGEGITIGAIGAGAGVVLGVVVMVLGRPFIQPFVSRVITGLGITFTDVLGPVVVALVSVTVAVLIPARTASKVPTTTALQGRMPALSPRKWVVPVGIGMAAAGFLLISVSIVSPNTYAAVLVGVGAAAVVGGVAMLSSPILAGVAKLSDRVPATGRLVLRDSGRNRTRSAVAVAAIMVILLAPVTAMVVSASTEEKDLVFGLPDPGDQLVLSGTYTNVVFGSASPITDADVAALAAIVPERDVAVFDTLDLRVTMGAILDVRDSGAGEGSEFQQFSDGYPVAVANDELLLALGDDGVARSIADGEIAVLGIEEKQSRVEMNGIAYPAREYPVRVVKWQMPRILIPESLAAEFSDAESRPIALITLERPMSEEERQKMWSGEFEISGGYGGLDAATIYLIAGALTLVVVLIVVSLVTAVSAAEVDHEVRTIVAVGAPGSIRRRFLGLLTGYQTLVAMALALPLGLGLVWVFSSSQDYSYSGPFGVANASLVVVPWSWLLTFALVLPVVIGLLTTVSVRSAPVTPPRRAT